VADDVETAALGRIALEVCPCGKGLYAYGRQDRHVSIAADPGKVVVGEIQGRGRLRPSSLRASVGEDQAHRRGREGHKEEPADAARDDVAPGSRAGEPPEAGDETDGRGNP
jgi:hypothetical protein